jgi:hypothetical protein
MTPTRMPNSSSPTIQCRKRAATTELNKASGMRGILGKPRNSRIPCTTEIIPANMTMLQKITMVEPGTQTRANPRMPPAASARRPSAKERKPVTCRLILHAMNAPTLTASTVTSVMALTVKGSSESVTGWPVIKRTGLPDTVCVRCPRAQHGGWRSFSPRSIATIEHWKQGEVLLRPPVFNEYRWRRNHCHVTGGQRSTANFQGIRKLVEGPKRLTGGAGTTGPRRSRGGVRATPRGGRPGSKTRESRGASGPWA